MIIRWSERQYFRFSCKARLITNQSTTFTCQKSFLGFSRLMQRKKYVQKGTSAAGLALLFIQQIK